MLRRCRNRLTLLSLDGGAYLFSQELWQVPAEADEPLSYIWILFHCMLDGMFGDDLKLFRVHVTLDLRQRDIRNRHGHG